MRRKNDDLTLVCSYCNKNFFVKYADRHRVFCSKSCASKARKGKKDSRISSVCTICNKEFLHYGNRILCSRKCNAKYMSLNRIGENNPAFNIFKDKSANCLNCKKDFSYTMNGRDKIPQYCSKNCWDTYQKGKNKSLKGPAIYGTQYPYSFKKIKKNIRMRDDYTCCLCSKSFKQIPVHHIDYDKNNCEEENLICLCKRCHGLTNYNRIFWTLLFTAFISGSKIVKKGWGAEVHIVNNNFYCLKYLIFFSGYKFSHHYHNIKQELWHCVAGKLELFIEDKENVDFVTLNVGDKIEIYPKQIHQLVALKNSIIIEISTKDFPEDSIRLFKGD